MPQNKLALGRQKAKHSIGRPNIEMPFTIKYRTGMNDPFSKI